MKMEGGEKDYVAEFKNHHDTMIPNPSHVYSKQFDSCSKLSWEKLDSNH